jgi:enamine deaminase RidA (YjgF/YER057c/UK114 family)
VFANVATALKGAGATPADVTKITIYIVGYKPELRPLLGEARTAVFGSATLPASTLVGVQALAEPGFLIEIEAIAVLDEA